MQPAYRYKALVERVVDGDTFRARVDLGFYCAISVNVRVRGVNTPERNETGGADATAWVRDLIEGQVVILESYKDRRSFERWVCDVWLLSAVDDETLLLSDAIIDAGHGVAA